MSKREKIMLLLWFQGPKTSDEIAEHMDMTWAPMLMGDVRCVVKGKLVYRAFEDGKAVYGLTGPGRDYCMRNYRSRLQSAGSVVDAQADTGDASESSGATFLDVDHDDDPKAWFANHVKAVGENPAINSGESGTAVETADRASKPELGKAGTDLFVAVVVDHCADVTSWRMTELTANSDFSAEAIRIAAEDPLGRTVAVYRLQLVGQTRRHVVFEKA